METKNIMAKEADHIIFWRGVFFILFGFAAFFWAGAALWAFVLTFGFFAIIDGIILIIMHINHRQAPWASSSLWSGIISILLGLYALFFPGFTAIVLGFLIALRAFAAGIFELKMAAHLKKHITGEILLTIGGILSIIFSIALIILLFAEPAFALLVLVELIGIYAFCFGISLLLLSVRLREFNKKQLKNIREVF